MVAISVAVGDEVRATRANGQPLTFKTRHEALLLGTLALAAPSELCREALAEAIWPHSDRTLARQNLRQRLATLRHQLGDEFEADRQTVRLRGLHLATIVESESGEMVRACRKLLARTQSNSSLAVRPLVLSWPEIDEEISGTRTPQNLAHAVRSTTLAFALDPRHNWEQRMGAAIAGASNAGTAHAELVMQAPLELRAECPPDLAAQRALAYLHQQAARLAHVRGDWQMSITHERESVRRFAQAQDPLGRAWATFRTVRKSIDLRLSDRNYQDLQEMRRLTRLPGRLLGFIEMNLVHAGALRGDWNTANRAFSDCLSRPEIRDGVELASWLKLNRATLQSRAGSPREALISLEEAAQTTGMAVPPHQCFWQWVVGVQVFAALNDVSSSALLFTLAERVRKPQDLHHTPTNQRALQAVLDPLARAHSPSAWLDAVAEAQAIPLVDAHGHYCDMIRQARRTYAV